MDFTRSDFIDYIDINMTKEDRELLLKDLSARLPYRTQIHIEVLDANHSMIVSGISEDNDELSIIWLGVLESNNPYHIIKPYLRPMSSMTDKEQREWHYTTLGQRWITENNIERCVDWLNEHHFDYRGLIEKGLALEAPNGMYGTEEKLS